MATTKYHTTRTTGPGSLEVSTVDSSAGAGDDGKIPSLDATGRLDNTFMPTGIGAASFVLETSDALSAGDFVNIWNDAGTAKVRLADNSNGREANGFVDAAYAATNNATVFYGDQNADLTGLTVGTQYYLATAGGATSTQPTTAGAIIQALGKSVSATSMQVELAAPIELV